MADLRWDRNFALEQAGEEEEILKELLLIFRQSCASDLAKIREGMKNRDAEGAADAAHSIKGAAASLGIEGIRQIVNEMEAAGRAGQLELIAENLPELESMITQLEQLQ